MSGYIIFSFVSGLPREKQNVYPQGSLPRTHARITCTYQHNSTMPPFPKRSHRRLPAHLPSQPPTPAFEARTCEPSLRPPAVPDNLAGRKAAASPEEEPKDEHEHEHDEQDLDDEPAVPLHLLVGPLQLARRRLQIAEAVVEVVVDAAQNMSR